jgi:hypothetical protein
VRFILKVFTKHQKYLQYLHKQELTERCVLHTRVLRELDTNVATERQKIMTQCQQMIDTLIETRDSLCNQLDEKYQKQVEHFKVCVY